MQAVPGWSVEDPVCGPPCKPQAGRTSKDQLLLTNQADHVLPLTDPSRAKLMYLGVQLGSLCHGFAVRLGLH